MATKTKPRTIEPIEVKMEPDLESVVPYYSGFGSMFKSHFGKRPTNYSLCKYVRSGFPIKRGGPYIKMPVFRRLKQVYTTRQAIERWLTLVSRIESDLGLVPRQECSLPSRVRVGKPIRRESKRKNRAPREPGE